MVYTNLISVNKKTKIYPNRDVVNVTLLNNDNTTYETDILKEECELALCLKQLGRKLNSTQMDKLASLIEDYGQVMYEKGCDEASYEG